MLFEMEEKGGNEWRYVNMRGGFVRDVDVENLGRSVMVDV
jgi:hypothetical protein